MKKYLVPIVIRDEMLVEAENPEQAKIEAKKQFDSNDFAFELIIGEEILLEVLEPSIYTGPIDMLRSKLEEDVEFSFRMGVKLAAEHLIKSIDAMIFTINNASNNQNTTGKACLYILNEIKDRAKNLNNMGNFASLKNVNN